MLEEYECLICGGKDDLYDNERDHEPIGKDEDPAFFDYSWKPAYQSKPEEE
jgi:hypothetical protein